MCIRSKCDKDKNLLVRGSMNMLICDCTQQNWYNNNIIYNNQQNNKNKNCYCYNYFYYYRHSQFFVDSTSKQGKKFKKQKIKNWSSTNNCYKNSINKDRYRRLRSPITTSVEPASVSASLWSRKFPCTEISSPVILSMISEKRFGCSNADLSSTCYSMFNI